MTDPAEAGTDSPVSGLLVGKCLHCGTYYFPRRLICRRCGVSAWVEERSREGVIEETTTVMHVVGGSDGKAIYLATVRTVEGPRIIVGLDQPLPEGTRVTLLEKNGAPLARSIGR